MYKEPQQSVTLVSRPILESISMNFLFRLGQGDCPFRPHYKSKTAPKRQLLKTHRQLPFEGYHQFLDLYSVPPCPIYGRGEKKCQPRTIGGHHWPERHSNPLGKKSILTIVGPRNGRRVDSKFQFVSRFLSLASMRMPWWSEDSFENWLCC